MQPRASHVGLKFSCLYAIKGKDCVTTCMQTLKHNILRFAGVDDFVVKVHLLPEYCNISGTVVMDGRFNAASYLEVRFQGATNW